MPIIQDAQELGSLSRDFILKMITGGWVFAAMCKKMLAVVIAAGS